MIVWKCSLITIIVFLYPKNTNLSYKQFFILKPICILYLFIYFFCKNSWKSKKLCLYYLSVPNSSILFFQLVATLSYCSALQYVREELTKETKVNTIFVGIRLARDRDQTECWRCLAHSKRDVKKIFFCWHTNKVSEIK